MAAIAIVTAGKIELVESKDQHTLTAGVAITAGVPINIDANGNWQLANSTTIPLSTGVYIATRSVNKGEALTGVRSALLNGYDFTAQAYNAPIYLSDAGGLADSAGAQSVMLGRVLPALANNWFSGAPRDKVLKLNAPA
jgi:hypothetical protein